MSGPVGSLGVGMGSSWTDIVVPAYLGTSFDWLPFTIQRYFRTFRPDPAWTLRVHANIGVAKSYYVDKSTGNDDNTGADWANALKTEKIAAQKPDVDRIYIRNSFFNYSEIAIPTRNVEIIAVDDNVYFSADLNDKASAFTPVDSHYEATFSSWSYVANVYDESDPSKPGWWGAKLIKKTSIAEVDATPGSYYYVYGATSFMYIHLFDDRAPDAELHYAGSSSWTYTKDNQKIYMQGVHLWISVFRNATAAGGTKAYLEDCSVEPGGITTAGVDEMFLDGVPLNAIDDGHNIDARNGKLSYVIELNCDMQNRSNATSDQASTAHNGCVVLRINGNYHDVSGQVVADVNGSVTWMLGSVLNQSRVQEVGAYTSGIMCLDCVTITGCNTDLQNVGGSLYVRNLISGGNFIGIITPY